jgi:hypothetical protein
MSYIGKNPKVKTVVLDDVGLAAQTNPAAGSHKLVNRGGTVKVLDSAGSESSLGGGSGEINLVDNSSDAGNWVASGAGVTVATTTTSTDLPLGGVVDTAIKLTPVSGTDYARYRFTMPAGLKNRKLKIEWFQRPLSGYTSGDFKVEIYKNAASNYSGAYTEFTLSTDASGDTLIPNATGKFTTTFDADDGDYYELRYVRVAGTTALNLASVIVGPGTQPQGAVVGSPVSLTFTSNQTGGTHTITAFGERVGSSLRLKLRAVQTVSAGTQASTYTLTMAAGLSIDLAALPGGTNSIAGIHIFDNSAFGNAARALAASSTTIVFRKGGTSGNLPGTDFQVNYELQSDMTIPIAEWAGSGTVNVAQNDVEFASSTTGSWDADASVANAVYGPNGSPITGALTAFRTKLVKFQTPIQVTDVISLEVRVGTTWEWIDISKTAFPATIAGGSQSFGAWLSGTGTPGDTNVAAVFSQYLGAGTVWNSTTGAVNWSTGTFDAWRVRKTSAGAAVGFGIVNPGISSGLVSASGVPGLPSGTIPDLNIGNHKSVTLSSIVSFSSPAQNAWNDIPGSSIVFPSSGLFKFMCFIPVGLPVSGGNTNSNYVIQVAIRRASTVIFQSSVGFYLMPSSVSPVSLHTIPLGGFAPVSASDNIYLSIRYFYGGGAADIGTKSLEVRCDVNPLIFNAVRFG